MLVPLNANTPTLTKQDVKSNFVLDDPTQASRSTFTVWNNEDGTLHYGLPTEGGAQSPAVFSYHEFWHHMDGGKYTDFASGIDDDTILRNNAPIHIDFSSWPEVQSITDLASKLKKIDSLASHYGDVLTELKVIEKASVLRNVMQAFLVRFYNAAPSNVVKPSSAKNVSLTQISMGAPQVGHLKVYNRQLDSLRENIDQLSEFKPNAWWRSDLIMTVDTNISKNAGPHRYNYTFCMSHSMSDKLRASEDPQVMEYVKGIGDGAEELHRSFERRTLSQRLGKQELDELISKVRNFRDQQNGVANSASMQNSFAGDSLDDYDD